MNIFQIFYHKTNNKKHVIPIKKSIITCFIANILYKLRLAVLATPTHIQANLFFLKNIN